MDRPTKIYLVRTLLLTAVYMALNAAVVLGAFNAFTGVSRWVVSASVALPIAGQIWATLSMIRDCDEFMRSLMARRYMLASGLAIAAASAWGYAETYAQAPHAPGWWVYVLFWLFFGAVSPFVRSTRG